MRVSALRRGLTSGLVAGAAILYLCAVGMVGTFAVRNLVGTSITLGKVLLWLPPIAAGFGGSRPRRTVEGLAPLSRREVVLAGGAAGITAGVVTVLALGFVELLGVDAVRGVMIQVSQDLIDVLTFHMGAGTGAALFVVLSAGLGLAGSALRLLPAVVRRAIVGGLVSVVAMGLLQRIVPTALSELGVRSDWLYSSVSGGLTDFGAVLTFAATAAIVVGRDRWGGVVRERREALDPAARRAVATAVFIVAAVVLAVLPWVLGSIVSNVLGFVGISLLLGLGLNVIVGNAGLLNLGFVLFYAIGAYTVAILMGAAPRIALGLHAPVVPFKLSFYVALPIVMAVGALVGALVAAPTVRLRGDYLAIVTLGFGAMASILAQSDWLKDILGGPQGMRDISTAPLFGTEMQSPQHFYYLAVVACALMIFVSWRLTSSRIGRAWNAMREDEQVAEAMGISVVRYKLLASAIGGAMGAMGGALFAVKIGSLTAASFTIDVSITALAIIILGGLGSIRGAVVGALVLIGLPNLLVEFENFRPAIYGAVLIAIMLLRPQGLLPNVRVARELQEEERAQDQWVRERMEEQAPVAASEGGPAS